jgi:hypothetical protein
LVFTSFDRISTGAGNRIVCDTLGVSSRAFAEFRRRNPDFASAYNEAVKLRARHRADETIDIADRVLPEAAHVAAARLQITTRQWAAEVDDPSTFGKAPDAVINFNEMHLTVVQAHNRIEFARRRAESDAKRLPAAAEDAEILEVTPAPPDLSDLL